MNITPMSSPVVGEHVVGTEPVLAPAVDAGWRQRLHLYTGRSLSDIALHTEQAERAGRLATRGQLMSAGVISGLEVGFESAPVDGKVRHFFSVAAGSGLAASGEDVVVPRAMRVDVQDVRVYAPVSLLSSGVLPATGALVARELGPTLGELIKNAPATFPNAANLPHVGFLVLQPVVTEMIGIQDPTDPCEQDPQNDPFDDWQIVDGCRLLLYSWPTEWLALPADDGHWRNILAHTLFNAEVTAGSGQLPSWVNAGVKELLQPWAGVGLPRQLLPWEEVGVPIGLVAFDAAWNPLFVDRHSVVRAGGKPRARSPWMPGAGTPFLWQARIQQYAEQFNEASLNGQAIDAIGQQFRYLPPVGLMPVQTAQPRQGHVHYVFPPSYAATIKPVPVEQLDVVMEESASLAPFDLTVPDHVEVLVPVPQIWYEPDLLKTETVDPAFQQAINRFSAERLDWLERRSDVGGKASAVNRAISGVAPVGPYPDPDGLADEPLLPFADTPVHVLSALIGENFHQLTIPQGSAAAPLTIGAGETLYCYVYLDPQNRPTELMLQWSIGADVEHRAYWGANVLTRGTDNSNGRRSMGALPAVGQWVRLEVPASQVGLETTAVSGLTFLIDSGRVAWGPTGKSSSATGSPRKDTPWIDGVPPAGAQYSRMVLLPVPHTPGVPALPPPPVLKPGWVWSSTPLQPFAQLSPPEDSFGTQLAGESAEVVAPMDSLKKDLTGKFSLTQSDIALLDARGLQHFIDDLQSRVREADDAVDFGFLRVQTDIYRVRQIMLGNVDATRFAASPTLAGIAQGDSAVATREQLTSFWQRVKSSNPGNNFTLSTVPEGFTGANNAAHAGGGGGTNTAQRFVTADQVTMALGKTPSAHGNPTMFTDTQGAGVFATTTDASVMMVSGKTIGLTDGGTDFVAGAGRKPISVLVKNRGGVGTYIDGAADTGIKDIYQPNVPPQVQVVGQTPIVGETYDFRTVTVAQRLKDPPAPETTIFARASKHDVVSRLGGLRISMDDIAVPIVADAVTGRKDSVNIGTLRGNDYNAILHEPNPQNADESLWFATGVETLDHTIAALRSAEGRIQNYRLATGACQTTLAALQGVAAQASQRLQVIAHGLAESRHNLAVAEGLLNDEQRRVDGINARRDAIIKDHVAFLAFRRARYSDLLLSTPSRALDPDVTDVALPACAGDAAAMPPELRSMVDLLRHSPIQWFTHVPHLLDRFDRLDILWGVIQNARTRAALYAGPSQVHTPVPTPLTGLGRAINTAFAAQRHVVAQYRVQTAQLDLGDFVNVTWQNMRDRATQHVSLGDLIDTAHGRSDVSQGAIRELNNIADVTGCLYGLFGTVRPAIRLEWAERLSEYEAAVNMRNLSSLPHWAAKGPDGRAEIDVVARLQMQGLVDWLYQRVDAYQPDAVSMISDLVRVCILVASHAPVNQIIAGHVAAATPVQQGGRITLNVDPARVRVGMHVLMYHQSNVVARGVVEDLSAGQAAARVIHVATPNINLAKDAVVHFAEPAAFL